MNGMPSSWPFSSRVRRISSLERTSTQSPALSLLPAFSMMRILLLGRDLTQCMARFGSSWFLETPAQWTAPTQNIPDREKGIFEEGFPSSPENCGGKSAAVDGISKLAQVLLVKVPQVSPFEHVAGEFGVVLVPFFGQLDALLLRCEINGPVSDQLVESHQQESVQAIGFGGQ